MNRTFPTKRVRYMESAVWDAIRAWGSDKGLEMADALALLWQLQREREMLDVMNKQLGTKFVRHVGGRGRASGDGGRSGQKPDRAGGRGRVDGNRYEQSGPEKHRSPDSEAA